MGPKVGPKERGSNQVQPKVNPKVGPKEDDSNRFTPKVDPKGREFTLAPRRRLTVRYWQFGPGEARPLTFSSAFCCAAELRRRRHRRRCPSLYLQTWSLAHSETFSLPPRRLSSNLGAAELRRRRRRRHRRRCQPTDIELRVGAAILVQIIGSVNELRQRHQC